MSILNKILEMYKSTLFSRYDPDGTIFYFSSDDFPGLNKEPLCFKNKHGNLLFGAFYYYPEAREDKLVIFEHGMGAGGHRAYMREIEMLARRGVKVFSYDRTGCFESEGEHINGFAGSLSDLDDCLNALVALGYCEGCEISIVGHSWGGFSTMNIPAIHPEVKRIVAMSGFMSVKDMQKEVIPFILAPFRRHLFALEEEANPDYVNYNAKDSLSDSDVRALIIHSVDDRIVSAKNHFFKLRTSLSHKPSIEFLLVNGKNHSPNYTLDAVSYKDTFFKALKKYQKAYPTPTEYEKRKFVDSFDWYRMTEQDTAVWEKIYETLAI